MPDEWQGRGIGSLLMRRLTQIARERCVHGFRATVLTGNIRMMRVFSKCGYPMQVTADGDVSHIRIPFVSAVM